MTKTGMGLTKRRNHAAVKKLKPQDVSKSRTLKMIAVPGKSEDRMVADAAADGLVSNAMTLVLYSKGILGEVSLSDCAFALKDSAIAVTRGDLAATEGTLTAQVIALNAIFGEMARRASLNLGEHLGASETYLRLAFKAQSQCRATLETLAAIRNPPTVFARQANIAHGPQQVNNGATATVPRAEETQTAPNELSGANDGLLPDARASQAASRAHPNVVPVEAFNGAA